MTLHFLCSRGQAFISDPAAFISRVFSQCSFLRCFTYEQCLWLATSTLMAVPKVVAIKVCCSGWQQWTPIISANSWGPSWTCRIGNCGVRPCVWFLTSSGWCWCQALVWESLLENRNAGWFFIVACLAFKTSRCWKGSLGSWFKLFWLITPVLPGCLENYLSKSFIIAPEAQKEPSDMVLFPFSVLHGFTLPCERCQSRDFKICGKSVKVRVKLKK